MAIAAHVAPGVRTGRDAPVLEEAWITRLASDEAPLPAPDLLCRNKAINS